MKYLVVVLIFVVSLFAEVDINHASIDELQALKGVGEKTAQNIVDYRKENGCFKDLKEIILVKGIGLKTFEKNIELIEVKPCS